ncbi:hypothetical protein ELQ35_20895 [Peribacillus cavernae]|uniref:YwqI/YxiC family protein n=1 Tax=Peribacillus cavernae TaxID=1674310 RepID=A0A3S0TR31_9BACI|nr:YwqI/YxiC family protein [Peribacillus cavernae]MDQ0221243.1 hypothetical protein [Peribacillus cavernae]RUQ25126.1 hypothetical protein ELQ35_20895 [Peribacillus cavernae]
MSKEIKMEYGEVEKVLGKLKSSANSLNASVKDEGGSNNLNVVKKLNKLNQDVQELAKSYQTLLIHNIEATQKSIQTMKDADEMISSSIRQR